MPTDPAEATADPAWRGKVQISDPTTSDANVFFWGLVREEYGEDLLRQIAANEPVLSGGAVPSAQAVAAGESAMAVPSVSAIMDRLEAEGAPVAYAMPEVTTGSEIAVGRSRFRVSRPWGGDTLAEGTEGHLLVDRASVRALPADGG